MRSSLKQLFRRRDSTASRAEPGPGQGAQVVMQGPDPHPEPHEHLPDNTQPVGTSPIKSFSTEYLGLQLANNSASHRDLGFTGELGGKWYAVYGDTLWCAQGVKNPANDTPGFHGMVRDAVSECTGDPLVVHDLNLNEQGRQQQFIPFNEIWGENITFGFGGTSLVETDARKTEGAVFYLVNANEGEGGLKGAGIARVNVTNGAPAVTQRLSSPDLPGYWWPADTTPRYGDQAAFRDPNSEYIYVWGGSPTSIKDWVGSAYVYLARVKACDAFELEKYEYYWGAQRGWKGRPLGVRDCNSNAAVMWNSGQGQLVWSKYFNCYIFVHLGPGSTDVFLRTASSPVGPWTPDVKVYTTEQIGLGLTYAGVAHPYLDESGKTLVISFTNNNNIEVIKVTFSE
ncbi:hypothetical protein BJ170DRAFT_174531 [Xylariales sp. AK1849]|nr:hypothetical protein BJ170DRAFT_174531 [Xylariales sp. AK1849]